MGYGRERNGGMYNNRHFDHSHRLEQVLNLDDNESSRGDSLEGGIYTDDEDQQMQPNVTARANESSGRSRDALPCERETVSPRVSSSADISKEQMFRQMTMMDMARYMWGFKEVVNAIQDFDKDLFAKMANIIFSDE